MAQIELYIHLPSRLAQSLPLISASQMNSSRLGALELEGQYVYTISSPETTILEALSSFK
jgi:hypothetical protein